jgi:hypothetical protein
MQGEEKAFLIGLPLDPNQLPSPSLSYSTLKKNQVQYLSTQLLWHGFDFQCCERKKKNYTVIFFNGPNLNLYPRFQKINNKKKIYVKSLIIHFTSSPKLNPNLARTTHHLGSLSGESIG